MSGSNSSGSQGSGEGNKFDKILKENAEWVFRPLIEDRLGVKIKKMKPLKEKMQTTLEREMDFFYEVKTVDGRRFLIQLEFQTRNDDEMVYRGAEYHGMALRRNKLPIRQFLIYLGREPLRMQTQLPENQVFRGFDVINIRELDYREMLSSQVPEMVIMALFGNYSPEQTEEVLRKITHRLDKLSKNKSVLSRYIQQLLMLSRLCKLEIETTKIINEMSLTIDIKNDGLYLMGKEEGREEGREEGKEEGVIEGLERAARKLLLKGATPQEVVEITDLPLATILRIQKEIPG